jgi:hypothetical protein
MEILVRQDELNREVLSRRVRLLMYVKPDPPGQLVVLCRNDGNKTAQNFYWHLAIPITVSRYGVWNDAGKEILSTTGMESHDGAVYRHYTGFVPDPLYPTRMTPVARIATHDMGRRCGGLRYRRMVPILPLMERCSRWNSICLLDRPHRAQRLSNKMLGGVTVVTIRKYAKRGLKTLRRHGGSIASLGRQNVSLTGRETAPIGTC